MNTIIEKTFFKKVPNKNFVFLRGMTALLGILVILSLWKDIPNIYASKGYINHEIIQVVEYNFEPRIEWITKILNNQFGLPEILSIKMVLSTYIIVLFLMGIGCATRITSIIAMFLWMMILNSSKPFEYGFDYFILSALFYCSIFPIDGQLKNILNNQKSKQVFRIYTIILQSHLSLVYFFNGLSKSLGETWWNGEAAWRAMNMVDNPILIGLVAQFPVLSTISTFLILFCEFFHPILMINYRTRIVCLIILIGMHVFIAIFMNLYFFSIVMIVLNIAAYWQTFSKLIQSIFSWRRYPALKFQ